ncbi:hypothetical protein [Nocardia camponoti]|uniref:Uncharacterized protein n=1 Tax=Nocardia camponoti TaxID=1616106 RepID=A0A917QQG8_9NOCA|nr:hypothetical protein [Nocardia camponoti]GGK63582.1 hypothetical protein GCM10011591_39750 [Nocardia camponoti]
MNQPVIEPPVMGIPREDTMRIALAARTLSGVLRQLREQRGRSAWDDAENVARKTAVLDRHAVTKFSHLDADEWNTAEKEGRIRAERHPDTGMTIRVSSLSHGRFGVQAGWTDNHAEAVFGSEELADRVVDWLRNTGSAEAVDDLRRNADELHATSRPRRYQTLRDVELAQARTWAKEHESDWYRWWEQSYAAADTIDGRRLDENEIIRKWVDATGGRTGTAVGVARRWLKQHDSEWAHNWETEYANCDTRDGRRSLEDEAVRRWRSQSPAGRGRGTDSGKATTESGEQDSDRQNQRTATPLADRLRGRVPDQILDDPRWHVAEDQYTVLTAHGVDPEMLIESVATIDFDSGQVRAPSGFAAWTMREAAKKGNASRTHARTEDDARRLVAEEWLTTADPESPFDRARAAQLVGEINDEFDALLARKYPGILDGDADQARAEADQHDATSTDDYEHSLHDATAPQLADASGSRVFAVDREGAAITVKFAEAPKRQAGTSEDAADHSAGTAQEDTVIDDQQHEVVLAAPAAAQAPLTPPEQDKANARSHRRTPPPAKPAPAPTHNRGRTH